jgi:hypothetical protein
LGLLEEVENKCGEDFSNCKIISKEEILEQKRKQEKILHDLKTLRMQTRIILNKSNE